MVVVLDFKLKLAKPCVYENEVSVVPFAVILHGYSPSPGPSRYLIALDSSWSMDGAKFFVGKYSILSLIDLVAPSDTVSVYSFKADVKKVAEFNGSTSSLEVRRAIMDVKLGGGTDIYRVLQVLYRDAVGARDSGSDVKVILVTDGMPTVGVRDRGRILEMASKLGEVVSTGLVIGVGGEYDEQLLFEISKRIRGEYEHLSDVLQMPEVFKTFVVSRKAVAARNVRLFVKHIPGVAVKVHTHEAYYDGDSVVVDLGPVYHGERVTVFGELVVAEGLPRGLKHVANVTVRYADRDGEEREQRATLSVAVVDKSTAPPVAVDERLFQEVSLVKAARILMDSLQKRGVRDLEKLVSEIANSTASLELKELYSRTIDLRERVEREGVSGEAAKALLALIAKILSGKLG
uniref:VWA domain-containing protein n=1 Tax=Ignisphaera aggregans TaxID=334771 RepID=A0A7C4FGK3_9CREN